ncbi:TatD family hydrolase [Blattabacterium cuenoti]|uniref:TatD family hydrolase n=1 Tax=Blattabacterium cuenoti TaxID=1653831 RepID=UPI00163B98E9|nr:TatD family hydrolase [Blattabacterium cuenoti]
MKLMDTHTHLYMKEFEMDRDIVIKRAIKSGINRFFLPSIDSSSILKIWKLKTKYPNLCYPMIGLHPNKVHPKNLEKELKILKKWLNKHSFIAIGEVGIDLDQKKRFFMEQEYVFKTQIKWAKEKKLPIIIHCRNSFNKVIKILKKHNVKKGIFHCFSGSLEEGKEIINLGFKLGIGGMITFKKNNLCHFLHKINIKNIVLETDSPFLSPFPFRGKRNEPLYLKIILRKLSQIYSFSEEKIADIINNNTMEIFEKL